MCEHTSMRSHTLLGRRQHSACFIYNNYTLSQLRKYVWMWQNATQSYICKVLQCRTSDTDRAILPQDKIYTSRIFYLLIYFFSLSILTLPRSWMWSWPCPWKTLPTLVDRQSWRYIALNSWGKSILHLAGYKN